MQWSTAAILRFISAVGVLAIVAPWTSALAQTSPPDLPTGLNQADLARLAADLAYPNSAHRFFEAGDTQFEREIQRVLDKDERSEPELTVDPEILEQLED